MAKNNGHQNLKSLGIPKPPPLYLVNIPKQKTNNFLKCSQFNIPKKRGGGGVEDRLEFFRIFIRLGTTTLPQV